jgi:predicted nucleotidyltransferase
MQINLDGIENKSVCRSLQELSERVVSDFSDKIISITVTGSALTDDFTEGKSDINTVLVFKEDNLELLDRVSEMGKFLVKNRFHMPLIMTPDYISRSADVFGVEYLDFQLNHKTIYGASPFESLSIDKRDVRLQCEREFKASLIRLRQGYTASRIGSAKLEDILLSCGGGILPYLRAALWLDDNKRDPHIEPTIEQTATAIGFDGEMLKTIIGWKYKKSHPGKDDRKEAMRYLYGLIDSLAVWADNFEI